MKRLVLILFFFSPHLLAQTFTVIGDRIELPYNRSTSSSVVYEQDDFNSKTNLRDVLQNISGLSLVENGPYGGTSTYFLRGFGRGQVKVYLDGIEISDPTDIDRGLQLQHFPLTGIKRIEVIKGAQGALYGADASGGVILLTSDDSTKSKMHAGIASNETWSGGFYTQAKQGDWAIKGSGDLVSSDGISAYNESRVSGKAENDFYLRRDLNLALVNNRYQTGLRVKVVSAKQDIDSSLSGDIVNNDLSRYDHRIYSVFSEQKSDSGQLKSKVTVARSEIKRTVQTNNFEGHVDQVHLELTWLASELSATTLFSDYSKDFSSTSSEFKNKEQENMALGVSHFLSLGRFFSDQSLRVDKAQAYATRLSSKLGLGFNLNENVTIKSQLASGFKAPTLYQRFSSFGGSENLKATTTESVQLGLAYTKEKIQAEVMSFMNRSDNLIDYNQASSQYFNLGKTKTYGVELSGKISFDKMKFQSSITWMKARNELTGVDLERRPRWFSTNGLGYSVRDDLELRASHQAVSKRYDQGKLPYYDTYNLGATYTVQEKFIDLDILNIFDRDYENVRFYGTLGRNYRLQFRWSL